MSKYNFPTLGSKERAADFIVTREEWNSLPTTIPPIKFESLPIEYVTICHTAREFCRTRPECVKGVRLIQGLHIFSNEFRDISYNFLIGGDGMVYEGRGWDIQGEFANTKYHSKIIGVAFMGDYRIDVPSKEQLDVYAKLMDLGVRLKKLKEDYKVVGQDKVKNTVSPGPKLLDVIKKWKRFSSTIS